MLALEVRRPALRYIVGCPNGGRWSAVCSVYVAAVTLSLPSSMCLAPVALVAQEPSAVSGTVRDLAGWPLAGADAFLLETLEGSLTDDVGGFRFDTRRTGSATLVVQKSGYLEVRRPVDLPLAGALSIVMQLAPIALVPITVEAGTFRLGNLPDVTLSDLEVVRTPGAAADPFRAIQTFPGVQSVGEGAGLFVRGGDLSETRVLLDGATVLSPFRLDTDRTISFGRFNPFQLRGIHSRRGGFGAEHGDALSAIADLQSVGKPSASELGISAAIGGLSGGLSVDLSESVGFRVTGTRTDTDLLMRLNGRRDEFDEVPKGNDVSGGGEWAYRPGGSLKAFALVQTDQVGVRIDDPSHSGVYRSDARADLFAVSGLDGFGAVGVKWGLATSGSRKDEDFGAFRLERDDRLTQARAKIEVPVWPSLAVALGAELEYREADLAGSVPTASYDNAPDASKIVFSSRESGARLGGFGQAELQPSNVLRLLLGLRADQSTFTGRTTLDPAPVGNMAANRDADLDRCMGCVSPNPRSPALRAHSGRSFPVGDVRPTLDRRRHLGCRRPSGAHGGIRQALHVAGCTGRGMASRAEGEPEPPGDWMSSSKTNWDCWVSTAGSHTASSAPSEPTPTPGTWRRRPLTRPTR